MDRISTAPPGLPEFTIGWDVIDWCEYWLEIPHGEAVGEPWRFTKEQGRFILWWYAVDETGKFIYRRGVIRRSKGWGKDPMAAVIAMVELMGPCRFGGWDDDGQPYGIPVRPAWVSIGAVSEEQTRTTTSLFSTLLPRRTINAYNMQIGEKIVRAWVDGSRQELRPVTASYRSNEGARPTVFLMNETHHWIQGNHGILMADVVRRNLAKSPGGTARALALTNAHSPGEGSVAELDYNAWLRQADADYDGDRDILYDSVEPLLPEDFELLDKPALLEAMGVAYGDSYWVDLDRLAGDIADPAPPNTPNTCLLYTSPSPRDS